MPVVLTRFRVAAVAAVVAVPLIGGGLSSVFGATDSSHPYSDPAWYPIRVEAKVDCVMDNPGCTSPHNFWGMDVTPTGQGRVTSKAGVYAMGSGIAHIGNANGAACGKENSFGTWVWVDHGGGIISRYGHLSKILIREGSRVSPSTALGVVGSTGKRSNCHIAYTDFMIRYKGILGPSLEFKTLKACGPRGAVTWPTGLSESYPRWNDTPKGTVVPASTNACIPTAAPATPGKPTAQLASGGTHKLKVTWSKPAASAKVNGIRMEFAEYHPSTKAWDAQHRSRWANPSVSATSVTFKGLNKGHNYRVRVYFHNAKGWSLGSSFVKKHSS